MEVEFQLLRVDKNIPRISPFLWSFHGLVRWYDYPKCIFSYCLYCFAGTVVKRKHGKLLADLAQPGDEVLVARGGQGGVRVKNLVV